MIYIVYGTQPVMIKNRVKKICKEYLDAVDDMNYVRFDANNTLIQECVDDANYLPLGYERKVVLIENCYFLNKGKAKKLDGSQDFEPLKSFIKSKNEESIIILTLINETIDAKNEIVELITQNGGKVFQVLEPDANQWKEYVKKYCRETLNMTIDQDALYELANRTQGDIALFQNEAVKLSLYSDHITYEDILFMVNSPLEENAFQIFNFLISGQNDKALAVYRDLRVANIEPVTLVSLIAGRFRLMNEISFLSKKFLTNDEIAKELGAKPMAVQILRKNLASISEESIRNNLELLYELDMQIKSGTIDRFFAFELYLINFKR